MFLNFVKKCKFQFILCIKDNYVIKFKSICQKAAYFSDEEPVVTEDATVSPN
jgi:hypothetical protein